MAGGHHSAGRHQASTAQVGSFGNAERLPNASLGGTSTGTAALSGKSKLTRLSTTPDSHISRICNEVAKGRSFATQTINQNSRQVANLEAPNARIRRSMHEGPDGSTNTGHDCVQGRLGFPQVYPEPHCAPGHDVESSEGL